MLQWHQDFIKRPPGVPPLTGGGTARPGTSTMTTQQPTAAIEEDVRVEHGTLSLVDPDADYWQSEPDFTDDHILTTHPPAPDLVLQRRHRPPRPRPPRTVDNPTTRTRTRPISHRVRVVPHRRPTTVPRHHRQRTRHPPPQPRTTPRHATHQTPRTPLPRPLQLRPHRHRPNRSRRTTGSKHTPRYRNLAHPPLAQHKLNTPSCGPHEVEFRSGGGPGSKDQPTQAPDVRSSRVCPAAQARPAHRAVTAAPLWLRPRLSDLVQRLVDDRPRQHNKPATH
ncbi:hypothetical protein F4560_000852 [Saccharothrix ecbatanensis]|uniref:Uncharacterized protein n=1 Tax=Saccharothrix ecbatanensis TaxID=1105145 RepID=A0A7W9HFJ9_9PSEU|nr:hypothetical protein [Saccharothrix ecbatanensis]